jgi:hypothetical protein
MKKTHLAKNIPQCDGWLAFGKTEHQTKLKLAALHLSVKCRRKISGKLVHIELTATNSFCRNRSHTAGFQYDHHQILDKWGEEPLQENM